MHPTKTLRTVVTIGVAASLLAGFDASAQRKKKKRKVYRITSTYTGYVEKPLVHVALAPPSLVPPAGISVDRSAFALTRKLSRLRAARRQVLRGLDADWRDHVAPHGDAFRAGLQRFLGRGKLGAVRQARATAVWTYRKRRVALAARFDRRIRQLDRAEMLAYDELHRRLTVRVERAPCRARPGLLLALAMVTLHRERRGNRRALQLHEQRRSLALPKISYARGVALLRRLVADHPAAANIHLARYHLGVALMAMGQAEKGHGALLSCVCGVRPAAALGGCPGVPADRGLEAAAWMRIGLHRSGDRDRKKLAAAAAAFERVVALGAKAGALLGPARYLLGWTQFRMDRFALAIQSFDALLAGPGAGSPGLREAATRFVRISLAEKDWDGDTIPDDEAGLARLERRYGTHAKKPRARDLYRRLAVHYLEFTMFDEAIAVLRRMLVRWPRHPDAPALQQLVIAAHQRMRRFEEAMKERQALARLHGHGSAWWRHNSGRPAALKRSRRILAWGALSGALLDHTIARRPRHKGEDPGKSKQLDAFDRCARQLGAFLALAPDARDTPEVTAARQACRGRRGLDGEGKKRLVARMNRMGPTPFDYPGTLQHGLRALRHHAPAAIHRCGLGSRAAAGPLPPELKIGLRVDPRGRVSSVRVQNAGGGAGAPGFERCLERAIARWRFPPPTGGPAPLEALLLVVTPRR